MKLSFTGRRALVTGGNSRLGLELSRKMIEAGIFPTLTSRSEKGKAEIDRCLSECEGRYAHRYMDLSEPASIAEALSGMDEGIDYLVDLAQSDYEALVAAADPGKVAGYFAENVASRADLLKRVSRIMMKKRRGRLLFISSAAANRSDAGQGFYASAKLACEALYRNLGIELGGRGITTVSLRPGFVAAGRGERFLSQNREQAKVRVKAKIPAGRILTAEEVAETILFFLSDSARGFNATEILMDGGLSAGKMKE